MDNKLLPDFDTQLARLREAAEVETDTALARVLGITQGGLSSAKQRGQIPASWFVKAVNAFGVYFEWLMDGTGPKKRGERETEKVVNGHAPETLEAPSHQIIMVPMVEARLSAGNGSLQTDGTVERKYSFRSDFLRRKGNISQMVLMRVEGNSMSPVIEDGDVVLLDQSQTGPKAGSIYAVGVEDVIYLKQFDARPGKIILSSFNPDYAPFEIDTRGDLESCIRIIGRVIWLCREM